MLGKDENVFILYTLMLHMLIKHTGIYKVFLSTLSHFSKKKNSCFESWFKFFFFAFKIFSSEKVTLVFLAVEF
jgi:hypothetical protein